ncbi:hypothetical protein AC249_AIPGENE21975, partial [Exaiptasia diaphana]
EGLECYKCNSTKSSDDCGSNMKKTTCQSGTTECCDGVYSTTVIIDGHETTCKIYQKYCKGHAGNIGNAKCSGKFSFSWSRASSCCSGNLCNAGTHNRGSQALIVSMIASAMMLFVFQ